MIGRLNGALDRGAGRQRGQPADARVEHRHAGRDRVRLLGRGRGGARDPGGEHDGDGGFSTASEI